MSYVNHIKLIVNKNIFYLFTLLNNICILYYYFCYCNIIFNVHLSAYFKKIFSFNTFFHHKIENLKLFLKLHFFFSPTTCVTKFA